MQDLFEDSHSSRCEVIFHCHLAFPRLLGTLGIFCVLVLCISSLMKYVFYFSGHSYCLFTIELQEFFTDFAYKLLIRCCLQIFPPLCVMSRYSTFEDNFYFWGSAIYHLFFFINWVFFLVSYLRKFCLSQGYGMCSFLLGVLYFHFCQWSMLN